MEALLQFAQQVVSGAAIGCVYGLVALGFVLIYKATEVVNFAQGELLMVGAFLALTFTSFLGLNFWLGALLAILCTALFGYVLDRMIVRPIVGQPIFVMLGSLGTPTNLASMPLVLKKGLPHLFPLTAASQMYEPLPNETPEMTRLKFATFTPYGFGMRVITKWMKEVKGKKSFCVLHQDDEFGLNVARGIFDQLEAMGMKATAITTYKRGATDYSSQVAKMRAANCDVIGLGTIIRETIGAIAEARKIGWGVDIFGSVASYTPEVAFLGKKVVEGYYAVGQLPIPYPDTASAPVKKWMARYKAKFDKNANPQAITGYIIMSLFAEAAGKAGKDLTSASLVSALESIGGYTDIFGGPTISFSRDKHLGARAAFIAQIKGGRWEMVTDHILSY